MMGQRSMVLWAAVGAMALTACSKEPQPAVKKSDTQAWAGSQNTGYASEGYKAGDKAAWEAHLKARAERGQNEYSRTKP
jgi:outer membrane biogenesis lipoprotein LolB